MSRWLSALILFPIVLLTACSQSVPPVTHAASPIITTTTALPLTPTPGITATSNLPDATPLLSPATVTTEPLPTPATQPTEAPPTAAVPSATTSLPTPAPSTLAQFGQPTKTTGCQARGPLPDPACTPGAIFATATTNQICQSGYSRTVRDVPTAEKDQVYAAYGIVSHSAGEYEVDHLIPLELGGSNEIANLWAEPANPRPGFHEKDQLENSLHDQVCSGALALTDAQNGIATNWLVVYQHIPGVGVSQAPATATAQLVGGVPPPTTGPATAATSPTVPPATPAPASANVTASANVSNATPTQNTTVTVTGRLVDVKGNGIAGATMHTVWHYKSAEPTCDGGPTDASGSATCGRDISRATKGFQVVIDVTFTLGGQNYQTSTSFTPH